MPSYSEIYNYLINYKLITIMSIKKGEPSNNVEQFISSFSMSKVAADNKLPNKSVNRLPYKMDYSHQDGKIIWSRVSMS